MSIPRVRTRLTSSAPAPNPQDLSAIAMVIGPASRGPINVPSQINSLANLADFGFGPGPEMVGDILSVAGGPVYFTRSTTTTPGALLGEVTKQPGDAVALDIFGAIRLPGDANNHDGDLLFRSLQEGVTLTVVVGGMAGYAVAGGKDITLTVTNTTTAAQVVALGLGTAAGLIAQPALSGDADGTQKCGQALAKTAFDRGTLVYTAKGAGCLLAPGADANGGVVLLTQQEGVEAEIIVSGANAPLTISRIGSKLRIRAATDGASAVASTAVEVVKAISDSAEAADLGITAKVQGTGASKVAALAATHLDPVRIAHVLGTANATMDVVLSGRTVTVTDSADGDVNPTGTGTSVLAAIVADAEASFVLGAALLGSGAGLVGPKAATDLLMGDTGAVALSGTPNDAYCLQIKVVRGGTVGTQPYPTMIWAVDKLAGTATTPSWSGVTLIPASGEVALKDGSLDTGLTATFSGVLQTDDLFQGTTSAPTSGTTDILAAVDAAKAETRFGWGFLTGPDPVTRAQLALIDGRVRTWFDEGSRQVRVLWGVRDLSVGETVTEYQDSLYDEFLGYVSPRGFSAAAAAAVLHISPYTLRQYRRGTILPAASRKASSPCHENLGRVASGPLQNVLHLFYDEQRYPSLFDNRFIVPITHPQLPGFIYLVGSPTMADPSAPDDAGYTLVERNAIATQICRIASQTAVQYLNDSLSGTGAADRATGAVAGALALTARGAMEARINRAVEVFLFSAKTDGKASASPLPPGQRHVTVRADNNFLADRTIYMDVQWIPLGHVKAIEITVKTVIPS